MASNTYTAVGNKPDIDNIITNIAPDQTPLYNMLQKTKATGVRHEWLEDTLGEPAENKYPEGFTFFTKDAEPRVMLDNVAQIMSRGMQVTGTQEAVLHYGVKSEMGYQMTKVLKELAFDCERAILVQPNKIYGSMIGQPPTAPAPATVARQFAGLPYWIITNRYSNAGGARPLTFGMINNALEDTYNCGGSPSVLLVNPRNKRVISTFTAGNTKYMDGNKTHKLTKYIDVLETDFGIVRTLTDRFCPIDKVYGLSPEYIKKAFLRDFKTVNLPKDSDNHRKNVYGEWTLEMRAEKAHFVIEDLDGIVPGED